MKKHIPAVLGVLALVAPVKGARAQSLSYTKGQNIATAVRVLFV
jgi:hypothetical protein